MDLDGKIHKTYKRGFLVNVLPNQKGKQELAKTR